MIGNSSNIEKLEARAREDARLGIYNPDAYVIATLGPQPTFDPVGNYRHGEVGTRVRSSGHSPPVTVLKTPLGPPT